MSHQRAQPEASSTGQDGVSGTACSLLLLLALQVVDQTATQCLTVLCDLVLGAFNQAGLVLPVSSLGWARAVLVPSCGVLLRC